MIKRHHRVVIRGQRHCCILSDERRIESSPFLYLHCHVQNLSDLVVLIPIPCMYLNTTRAKKKKKDIDDVTPPFDRSYLACIIDVHTLHHHWSLNPQMIAIHPCKSDNALRAVVVGIKLCISVCFAGAW